jgi:hypothetical protein
LLRGVQGLSCKSCRGNEHAFLGTCADQSPDEALDCGGINRIARLVSLGLLA